MKYSIKSLLIAVMAVFCSFYANADRNWNSWYAYDFETDEISSDKCEYCYLDLVGFGRWQDGEMIGCTPGGKGEYMYIIIGYPLGFDFLSDDVAHVFWRNTGDGNWVDTCFLRIKDRLQYATRRAMGSDVSKETSGWMDIVKTYSNSQGRFLITLDSYGIARKFKVVITKHKR